jgi:arylsulfatase
MSDSTRGYPGFPGRVGTVFATSEPHWPARPQAPDGAPNIVVMLCDDIGFADIGCFGSEIDTPNLDRLAAEGVRYTNFHATPMCSPSRAALLTGLEPHSAGVGTVAHSDPGFPGYAMEIADDVATLPEILRGHGYSTLMVGKWHLAKDSHTSDAGPRHAWPLQKGFERYYGFLDGFTNFHHPHRLVEDNHGVEVDQYPDGYYLTDDLTDRAIAMIRSSKACNPRKPFFCYFAHGAVHAPLQAKADDIDKYADRYQEGWDAVRETRYRRQVELGVLPEGTALAPPNTEKGNDVPAWGDLSDEERELFARYQAVYAGMVDNIDQNFGRLRSALEDLGEWDNTIVIFTSDNGGSREGEEQGTSAYFRMLNMLLPDSFEEDHARLDLMGGPQTLPHYPRGWAQASNTPFRLYKINTHAGGHSVPFIVSWPAGIDGAEAGALRSQYTYITDITPTLLEVVGIDPPTERDGRPLKPMAGSSFQRTLHDGGAAATHAEQVVEMIGHRGFYRDGWEAVTLHRPQTPYKDDRWELYHLAEDPTELHDLAEAEPERLAELVAAWEEAAWENQIFPLDEGTGLKYLLRPDTEAVLEEPVTIVRGTPTLERYRSYKLMQMRSFTASLDLDLADGDEGMLLAHGDQGGGYALYLEAGQLIYVHNAYGSMSELRAPAPPAGTSRITLDVTAPGQHRWSVRVLADGAEVMAGDDFEMLAIMAPFEGIDVGIDRRSPVSWAVYERHGPFPFTGALRSATYTPGAPAPDAGAAFIDLLKEMGQHFD